MRGWNETKEEQQENGAKLSASEKKKNENKRGRFNAGIKFFPRRLLGRIHLLVAGAGLGDGWKLSPLFFPLSVNTNRKRGELLNRRNAEVLEINEHLVLKRSISLSVEYSGSG